ATPTVLGQAAASSVLRGGSTACGGAASGSPARAKARSAEPIETRKPKQPTANASSAGPLAAPAIRAAAGPAAARASRRAAVRIRPRTAGARVGTVPAGAGTVPCSLLVV